MAQTEGVADFVGRQVREQRADEPLRNAVDEVGLILVVIKMAAAVGVSILATEIGIPVLKSTVQ